MTPTTTPTTTPTSSLPPTILGRSLSLSLSLSLRDFVASPPDALSDPALRFRGLDDRDACDPPAGSRDEDSAVRALNATKLALLLTKAFVGSIGDGEADSTAEEGGAAVRSDPTAAASTSVGPDEVSVSFAEVPRTSLASGAEGGCEAFLEGCDTTTTTLVLGIDIRSGLGASNHNCHEPTHLGGNGIMRTPLQTLGRLLVFVYLGTDDTFNLCRAGCRSLSPHDVGRPSRDGLSSTGRKLRAHEETSSFATLLASGRLSAAVCRLLSDLLEAGDGTIAEDNDRGERPKDDPCISFDDVVRDLEQMVDLPRMFLYDPDDEFVRSDLRFGRGCYGRTRELTKILEVSTRLEQGDDDDDGETKAEAVFVSGVGGSGKTCLIQNVGTFLSELGWIVLKAKFKRDMEHGSREIVSSVFEDLVAHLAAAKTSNSDDEDGAYGRRAFEAIADALDPSALSSLATFLRNLPVLFPSIHALPKEEAVSHWQLVFLLTRMLGAVLGAGRCVMLSLDDLQWCDPTMLTLIKEIVASVGNNRNARRRFLFAGTYRDDEVNCAGSHPLAGELADLRSDEDVRVMEIRLSSLSKDDVADMIGSETRLPRRLVSGLADAVHKKTSGHALFVVQLLNSLVRDAVVSYSPRRRRYHWDERSIASLKTWDGVASLIVADLSSLTADVLRSLRILSCFGVHVPISLLKLFESQPFVPRGGIETYLPGLVERGIVEASGPSVLFTHDLIQQHVYDDIPTEARRRLHVDIGTSIAATVGLDARSELSVEFKVEELTLDESTRGGGQDGSEKESYPLVAIATNQINFAGPDFFDDRSQRIRFAKWNLRAGKDAAKRSNFSAALYYYKSGLSFLEDDGHWLEDSYQLCHELHEGAASGLLVIGDLTNAVEQATVIIDHVPFEDSLMAQYVFFRSLFGLGRYAESVSKGLEVLRKLDFDISLEPSQSSVMVSIAETDRALSGYSFDRITSISCAVDFRKRKKCQIVEALITSLFRSGSPYLPLVVSETTRYSLQNGTCEESVVSFLVFGYFKIALLDDYDSGRYWSRVCLKILESCAPTATTIRADFMCCMHLLYWFYPLKEMALRGLACHTEARARGEIESSQFALAFSLILSFYGGEKLSVVLNSMKQLIASTMRQSNKECLKVFFPLKLLIDELTRNPDPTEFPVFGAIIHDEPSLLGLGFRTNNYILVEGIRMKRFQLAFWMGDYVTANQCSQEILASPFSKMPKLWIVWLKFAMGLISFQWYRDGKGEEWLKKGEKALKTWSINSVSVCNFENKLLLLEAENHASMCNIATAKSAFEASVRSARDHGLVQEQALACELYAKFLTSIVEIDEALCWFNCAHACYMQWGAVAKAEQLWRDHGLGQNTPIGTINQFANKHGREW